MTETNKTLLYVGVAAVLTLLAFLLSPSPATPDRFLDQGEPFFPEFTNPNDATTLEVIEFDAETGEPQAFKVTFQDGRWVIPSHHNYPADAEKQLAQTAAGVIDIKRDDYRSDNVTDHELFGVVDPLDETAGLAGRGKRVTIKGAGGQVLADLIFGKAIEDREGFRYVRHPDEKRVYAARVQIDISTRFADWIDQDLLQLTRLSVDGVVIDDYTIDERTRTVNRRDVIKLERDGGEWTMDKLRSGQEVDSTVTATLLTTLDSLRIVGVRPKPQGLSASLKVEEGSSALSQADMRSLQSKGFYLTRDGQLMSNEGELRVHTNNGVKYTLRFGEVVYGSGLAATAGTVEEQAGQGGAQNRYLFVTTEFDASTFPEPPMPTDTSFVGLADTLLTEAQRENKRLYDEHKSWQRQIMRGRNKVQELNNRFADWYYVISDDSYKKLRLRRSQLIATGDGEG